MPVYIKSNEMAGIDRATGENGVEGVLLNKTAAML